MLANLRSYAKTLTENRAFRWLSRFCDVAVFACISYFLIRDDVPWYLRLSGAAILFVWLLGMIGAAIIARDQRKGHGSGA